MNVGVLLAALTLSILQVQSIRHDPGAGREDKVIGWSEKYGSGNGAPGSGPEVFIENISWQPRAYIYHGLATAEECDHIIELARPKMAKATTLDEKTKKQVPNKLRSNREAWLGVAQDDVVDRLEKRISRYTFLPLENGEPLHVMQYLTGQSYAPHTDFLEQWWHPQLGNERIATVILYLSDVAQGGETVFPNTTRQPHAGDAAYSQCAQAGVSVKPKKGDALMFYNLLETGRTDGYSMHAGCPVSKGEKWTATKRILVNKRPMDHSTIVSFMQRAVEHEMMAQPSKTKGRQAVP